MNLRGRNKIAIYAFAMSTASFNYPRAEQEEPPMLELDDVCDVHNFKQPPNPKDKIHVKPFYQKGRW